MLTGFWHGAAWNFVIWGLYFALLLILEKIWLLEILKKSHVLNRIYVLTAAVISFVIFDATDMSQAFSYLKAMFGTGRISIDFCSIQLLFPQLFCGLDDSPAWCDTDSKVLLQTDPAMENRNSSYVIRRTTGTFSPAAYLYGFSGGWLL